MATTPAQEARFRALASTDGIAAVSRYELGRELVLVARNLDREVVTVEALDLDGSPVPLQRICESIGSRRRQKLREAELAMQTLVALLAVNREAELNLTSIALAADASKQTLYNRLKRESVAP